MQTKTLRGWVLDAYIEGDRAVLWVKAEDGKIIRLNDSYKPSFYVKPKKTSDIKKLQWLLSTHPNITLVRHEKKYTSLKMEKHDVLSVQLDSVRNYRQVQGDLTNIPEIGEYYLKDLLHIQGYLYRKNLAPACKAEISYSSKKEFISAKVLDDSFEVQPPPFKTLIFSIEVSGENISPNVDADPISEITILNENLKPISTFEGDERQVLTAFQEYIQATDPDFLVTSSIEETLAYILQRARSLGFNLQLGRETARILQLNELLPYSHKGRAHIDLHEFQYMGIAGIAERSRFTLAPPSLAAKWPAGKIVDCRQCYEALKKDILIPRSRGFFQHVRTAKETIFSDRGGLILSPKVGLHENVAALDFESMYPHIITKHNVSYETATSYGIKRDEKGFLTILVDEALSRRLHFKHLRKKFRKDSKEWVWCEQRQTALKGILVVIYGYSGCFANRFSSVACYEQINRLARETLVKSMNIALAEGFQVIYADSDSLFVSKKGACREDFVSLAKKVSEKTGLPMILDKHFKFLVLLTQEADPNLEATRRYYGKLMNGDLFYRGIELRRHDCPTFLKKFGTRLMSTLFSAETSEDLWNSQYKKAFDLVVETFNYVRSGQVSLKKLVISKTLRKPVNSYRSLLPHVVAAMHMAQKGKRLESGEKIDFLYVNAEHKNPFRRVVPAAILDQNHRYYDREKYADLVLDVTETILGMFGFERKHIR